MPALVSHYHFASASIKQARPQLASIVAKAPEAFRWGAQGPDILYYHHPMRDNRVVRTGHRMHEERVWRTFSCMTAECARQDTTAATAYLLGFCCHYVLDRTVHPFITYTANYRLDPVYPYLSHSSLHNLCEAELDRALIEKYYPGDSADFRAYLLLPTDKQTFSAAGALLSQASWQVYGSRISSKTVGSAMRTMQRAQHMLHDKSGKRSAVVGWMETRVGESGSVSSLIRPVKPLPADCVNSSHNAWIDAAQPHRRCYTDFFQLFEGAQRPAAQLMEQCYDALQSGDPLPQYLFSLNFLGLPQ